jgi:tRNA(adenine34) deaminase
MELSADEAFMRLAIEASRKAYEAGDVPFGAALVKDGVLVRVSRNVQITSDDLMGHAEVALVREAARSSGREVLRGSTVYASGEPCAMCSGTMFWAGVSRVVFAATQSDIIEILGGMALPIRSASVLSGSTPPVRVEGPVLREEALAVLRRFGKLPL